MNIFFLGWDLNLFLRWREGINSEEEDKNVRDIFYFFYFVGEVSMGRIKKMGRI